MSRNSFALGIAPLLLALAVIGCGDDDNLPDATEENVVDTVSLGSLVGTPITTPSGFSVDVGAVRTDRTTEFDFAFNIEPSGRPVFLPPTALGLPPSNSADPGLQPRSESFDEITLAPNNGYLTEEPVPFAVGDRFTVRSRIGCSPLGLPRYAKIEVIALEGHVVDLKVLANTNCGYRGLEPGLPSR